jgi:hypothetical protein
MQSTSTNACRLSVPMRLMHRAPTAEHVYLTFRRTALMVELLDVPARPPAEEVDMVTLALRDVDARGLGLTSEDFADGVAVCHSTPELESSGWACEPVVIAGTDDRGAVALILDETDAARWLAEP